MFDNNRTKILARCSMSRMDIPGASKRAEITIICSEFDMQISIPKVDPFAGAFVMMREVANDRAQ